MTSFLHAAPLLALSLSLAATAPAPAQPFGRDFQGQRLAPSPTLREVLRPAPDFNMEMRRVPPEIFITSPESMVGRAGCTFYEHPNYGGASWFVAVDRFLSGDGYGAIYVAALGSTGPWWNDRISSVSCMRGEKFHCTAELFPHENLGGRAEKIWPENDGVSSEEAAEIHRQNPGGIIVAVASGPRNLRELNDQASSLRVTCSYGGRPAQIN